MKDYDDIEKFKYYKKFMKLFSIIAKLLINELIFTLIEKNFFNKFNKYFNFKTHNHVIFNHDFK